MLYDVSRAKITFFTNTSAKVLHKSLSKEGAHLPHDMEIILLTGVFVGKCQTNCYDLDANWENITSLIF
jgi:hypothetical protein